jgi:hypothetical protein
MVTYYYYYYYYYYCHYHHHHHYPCYAEYIQLYEKGKGVL